MLDILQCNALPFNPMKKPRKTHQVVVRISEEEKNALAALAESRGSTVSATVRLFAAEGLRKEEEKEKKLAEASS